MPTKTRTWYDCPVAGQSRSSRFVPYDSYSSLGPQSVESIQGSYNYRLSGGQWSGGGAMFLDRHNVTFKPNRYGIAFDFGAGGRAEGTARIEQPTAAALSLPEVTHPSKAQLLADGTTAIARIEPLNPAFSMSVFLGELRAEGLPHLPGHALKEQTRRAKAAGSEYLSVEFGWLPLVSGIRQFASAVDRSDQILRQYQEDANRVLQRSYEWPTVSDSRAQNMSFSMTPAVGFFTGGGYFQSVYQRKWLEAEFEYWLPTGNTINDKFRRYGAYARKLLGIDLSPEVLWNLAPWSWAADWFGNVGDVMHNVSALGRDGLVMRHAYVMCTTRRTLISSGSFNGGFEQVKTEITETKSRYPATPYGFGVSYDGLSATQIAVIAALGLSRW